MMINPSIVSAGGTLQGFKNYQTVSLSYSWSARTIPPNGVSPLGSAFTNLSIADSVCNIQIQYTGFEIFWRSVSGGLGNTFLPNYTTQQGVIVTTYDFDSSGNFAIGSTVTNGDGVLSLSVPAMTLNCRLFLFIAPF